MEGPACGGIRLGLGDHPKGWWWGSSFAQNRLHCYKGKFVVIVRYYPSVIGAVTNTKLKVYSAPMPPPLARGDMCRELSSKLTELRFV